MVSVPRSITARPDGPRRAADGVARRAASALPGAGGVTAASLAALALLWMPSQFKIGEFSIAFTVPFLLAAWVMVSSAPIEALGRALRGDGGKGLWIEALCMVVVILCAALSMLISPAPERAFRVILPMAYGLCALFILTRVSALVGRRLAYSILWSGVAVTAIAIILLQIAPLRTAVQVGYRFKGLFENSNQLALAITAIWPLLITVALTARATALKALCVAGMVILGYALFLSGAKTGLALTFAVTCVMLLYHSSRTGSLDSAFLSFAVVVALMALAIPFILAILSWASPIAFAKVEAIFTGGLRDYQTIQSRDVLWSESLRIGLANPLMGEGAGTRILDKAHSHNMILDYFRGMGVFAMFAASLLLIAVVARTLAFLAATWGKGRADRTADSITMALYLGAAGYLLGNQISDSFSPSTAFLFWVVYFAGYRSAQQPVAPVASLAHQRSAEWVPQAMVQRRLEGRGVHPA